MDRRDFLKLSTTATASVLVWPGATLPAREQPKHLWENQHTRFLFILEDYRGAEVRYMFINAHDWTDPTPPREIHVPTSGPAVGSGASSWQGVAPLREDGPAVFRLSSRQQERPLKPLDAGDEQISQLVAYYRQSDGPALAI